MKKHIGYFHNGDEVMEALRTKELYQPYMIYVEEDDKVQYDGYFFIEYYLNDNLNADTASVDYNQNDVSFSWSGYKEFWYEIVDVSDCLTFSENNGGLTGYTQSYNETITISENEGETARDAHFTLNLRDEDGGEIVYTQSFIIHQAGQEPVLMPVCGWRVDESVTDQITVPVEGATEIIVIENVSYWEIRDNDSQLVATGDTDVQYEVEFSANTSYDGKYGNYNVMYTDLSGNTSSVTLSYTQEGKERPTITVSNLIDLSYLGMYITDGNHSAVTFTFSGMSPDLTWRVSNDGAVIASGNTDDEYTYSIPNSNTGTTMQRYGSISAEVVCYNEDWQDWQTLVSKYCNVYLAPAGGQDCVFLSSSPETNNPGIGFKASQYIMVAYSYSGRFVTDWSFYCPNESFPDDWYTGEQTEFEGGSYVELNTSNNMLDSALTVTVTAAYKGGASGYCYVHQAEYQDPVMQPVDNQWSKVVYFEPALDGNKFVVASSRTKVDVKVLNMLPGDVWYASTGGSETSGTFPMTPMLRISGSVNNTGEVRSVGSFTVRVERNNVEIYNEYLDCYQAGANPQLCPQDSPDAVASDGAYITDYDGDHYIMCLNDPYDFYQPNPTGCTVDNQDWSVSFDSTTKSIVLNLPQGTEGSGTVSMEFINTKDPSLDTTVTLDVVFQSQP